MKKIVLAALCLLIPHALFAQVIVFKEQQYLDNVEILGNREGQIRLSYNNSLYEVDEAKIVKVTEQVPDEKLEIIDPAKTVWMKKITAAVTGTGQRNEAEAEDEPLPDETEEAGKQQAAEPAADLNQKEHVLRGNYVIKNRKKRMREEERRRSLVSGYDVIHAPLVDETDTTMNLLLDGFFSSGQKADRVSETDWTTSGSNYGYLTFLMGLKSKRYNELMDVDLKLDGNYSETSSNYYYGGIISPDVDMKIYNQPETFLGIGLDDTCRIGDHTIDNNVNSYLKIGIGRIFHGLSAYQAIMVIEQLDRDNCLLKSVSKDDMEQLSRIISKYTEGFILDERLNNIDRSEEVTGFLLEKGYIDSLQSILIVNDTLQYLYDGDVDYGAELYVIVKGNYNDSKTAILSGDLDNTNYVLAGLGYELALVINNNLLVKNQIGLYRDIVYNSLVETEYTSYSTDDYQKEFSHIMWQLDWRFELIFIPASRFNVTLSSDVSLQYNPVSVFRDYESRYYSWYTGGYTDYHYQYDYTYDQYEVSEVLMLAFKYQLATHVDMSLQFSVEAAYEAKKKIKGTINDNGIISDYETHDEEGYTVDTAVSLNINLILF